ncbi:MAG: hypothetical protein U5S82_05805 [Gammaproteobacteria bacterium]|nr:hypothetical protein [Gammaproteobacteria bacterium]
MRRAIILAISTVIVAAAVTGCNSPYLDTKSNRDADSLARIFLTRGETAIAALKDMLRNVPPGDTLDVQTAITLETARLPAGQVSDRRTFQQEADRLEQLIARGDRDTPTDSAVLAYLANLANGQSASASYLSQAEEEAVLKLCGPAHEVLAHAYEEHESPAQRLLRQSCFTWLIGDSEKSFALYYRASSANPSGRGTAGSNGFETFLTRLEAETGIDLLAHRQRLGAGPGLDLVGAGYGDTPGTTRVRQLSTSLGAP